MSDRSLSLVDPGFFNDPAVGQRSSQHNLLRELVTHYNAERYHQGLNGKLVGPRAPAGNDNGKSDQIQCRSRLGGLLNFYHREAA